MTIQADQLREMFQNFFQTKGHVRIASASVIPDNDPTVLFTTAGMHPLVPYLLGAKHPAGKRLTNVQKCIRTIDIDEVGDAGHLTLFEMLGNWSLGDYFKEEAIGWSYEFLTDSRWLNLPLDRLAVTVFAGDEDAPRDEESAQLWQRCGMPAERIFYLPKKHNWWIAGQTGPCGPDTEMFYITDQPPCGPGCSPACDCGRYMEIWNNVFMQYNKTAQGAYEALQQRNVDTGMGLERTVAVLNGYPSVYETDLFVPIIQKIEQLSGKHYTRGGSPDDRAIRIIADHIRTATMILGDPKGISPSNVDAGYVLRRLIRRAVRYGMQLGIEQGMTAEIAEVICHHYAQAYPELVQNKHKVCQELLAEEQRFARTLRQGLREMEKLVAAKQADACIDGLSAFRLYDTFGFPIEMTVELALEKGFTVDRKGYDEAFERHQQLSQASAQQRFQGGLADHTEQTARLHTATHLLHAALRKVLGPEVAQKGSNITAERLRFDFSWPSKMTPEQIEAVQALVNEAISADIPVNCQEMPLEQARQAGAIGLFESKYDQQVKVYDIHGYSMEICGGPHAGRTGELVCFKIQKEESSSAGIRRIKAVIE